MSPLSVYFGLPSKAPLNTTRFLNLKRLKITTVLDLNANTNLQLLLLYQNQLTGSSESFPVEPWRTSFSEREGRVIYPWRKRTAIQPDCIATFSPLLAQDTVSKKLSSLLHFPPHPHSQKGFCQGSQSPSPQQAPPPQ